MARNTSLQNTVTDADISAYKRDGVVCLRGILNEDWVKSIEPIARRLIIDKEDFGLLPAIPGRYMARCIPEFRDMIFKSPIAEACGELMESKEVRFFFDEIFAKPPESDAKTIWHCDRMGWPVTGSMVPSLWIPFTPVTNENSLECIAGSHTQDVPYWLFSPNARQMIKPDDRAAHPDCESLRGDGKTQFLSWEMNPGDMLVVHPWTLHYSSGNSANDWRIAASIRVFGDDIRWAPRPDCVNIAGVSFDEMPEGEKPQGSHFPLLWSRDGRRDGDANYPTGFATTWSKQGMGGVNEYDTFKQLKNKEMRGELGQKKHNAA